MKVALDTNVLLRYLTWDNAARVAEAKAVIERASTVISHATGVTRKEPRDEP